MRLKFKRVRLIIYTHDTQEQLDKQRLNDTKTKIWPGGTIESFELNPTRITLFEIFRLFKKERNINVTTHLPSNA